VAASARTGILPLVQVWNVCSLVIVLLDLGVRKDEPLLTRLVFILMGLVVILGGGTIVAGFLLVVLDWIGSPFS
jgi:hypothetical protein